MPQYIVYYDAVIHFSGSLLLEAPSAGAAERQLLTDHDRVSTDLTEITSDHIVSLTVTDVERN